MSAIEQRYADLQRIVNGRDIAHIMPAWDKLSPIDREFWTVVLLTFRGRDVVTSSGDMTQSRLQC